MAIVVDTEKNTYDEVIKVVGVGGGGGNAVNRMVDEGIKGVEYITVNTDARALNSSKAETKVQIGVKLTNGKGAGAKPEVGASSAEENRDEIKAALSGSDMVFIAAGMGGGTGTGAAPIVAEIAQELGILTVAVVTKPFEFEQKAKMRQAEAGIAELKKHVDSLIVIPNERLLQSSEKELTMRESFALADNILKVGVKSIAELITVEGDINLDFADVKTTMKDAGYAHMAIGHGSGKDKAAEAAKQVISSPLLETSISGATRLLVNIVMSEDALASDINTATRLISEAADPDVNMIFGTSFDENMKDEINITVIASAFNDDIDAEKPEEEAPAEAAPNVEKVPSASAAAPAKKTSIDEDYSEFFNMINKR
ncbi:MAG: cell division protein FtsZ [Oscillospiraceae bacterium]|nr:cell division protein FtsZ [Oscillospiraceae bacterium]MCI7499483.1 cell division protein FtsZ [Oscillospiraceae bacterium]MDD7280156.1 cell division protein FtsZ [Oscillospiraceae bacterium]MDY2862799.1 cell division protein FtsZ [Oscillospiraceae bacterium]